MNVQSVDAILNERCDRAGIRARCVCKNSPRIGAMVDSIRKRDAEAENSSEVMYSFSLRQGTESV